MKKKRLIIGLILIIGIFLSIFHFKDYFIIKKNNEKLQNSIISQKIDENNKEILLNDIVPFDWDKVYSFRAYVPKEEIEKVIGFKSKYIKQTTSEGMVRLIFVKEDKVISSIGDYPQNLLYNVRFNNKDLEYIEILKKDNVKVLLKKQDNIIYLNIIN